LSIFILGKFGIRRIYFGSGLKFDPKIEPPGVLKMNNSNAYLSGIPPGHRK
jgi:hypothetical protein